MERSASALFTMTCLLRCCPCTPYISEHRAKVKNPHRVFSSHLISKGSATQYRMRHPRSPQSTKTSLPSRYTETGRKHTVVARSDTKHSCSLLEIHTTRYSVLKLTSYTLTNNCLSLPILPLKFATYGSIRPECSCQRHECQTHY